MDCLVTNSLFSSTLFRMVNWCVLSQPDPPITNFRQRGGAWVVLDPSINPNHMQMYADVDARAGVLGMWVPMYISHHLIPLRTGRDCRNQDAEREATQLDGKNRSALRCI
jgi:acetyl-CoA carboxylase carboxyltransferase component